LENEEKQSLVSLLIIKFSTDYLFLGSKGPRMLPQLGLEWRLVQKLSKVTQK